MRALIAFATAALAFAAHADTLDVYRSIDAQGRVTYTNVMPKHDDYDVIQVEYETQPRMPAAAGVVPTATTRKVLEAPREAPAEARPIPATLRVVAFPSLRLAAATGEPAVSRRRKSAAAQAFGLRLDRELRNGSPGD